MDSIINKDNKCAQNIISLNEFMYLNFITAISPVTALLDTGSTIDVMSLDFSIIFLMKTNLIFSAVEILLFWLIIRKLTFMVLLMFGLSSQDRMVTKS